MTWAMLDLTSFSLETLLVSVQNRCMVCAKRTIAHKSFWTHPMVLLSVEAQVKARFDPFGHSAILMQDRCTVCVEHTIGSEIVLVGPDGTPRRHG